MAMKRWQLATVAAQIRNAAWRNKRLANLLEAGRRDRAERMERAVEAGVETALAADKGDEDECE